MQTSLSFCSYFIKEPLSQSNFSLDISIIAMSKNPRFKDNSFSIILLIAETYFYALPTQRTADPSETVPEVAASGEGRIIVRVSTALEDLSFTPILKFLPGATCMDICMKYQYIIFLQLSLYGRRQWVRQVTVTIAASSFNMSVTCRK